VLPLFKEPLGWAMLALALVMMGIGYAIIRKIASIEV
jgi:Flp pilus assembly protein TadB